ncbi:MAG: ATP-binding protein [Lachnospiraceae bacterium]|nr:ATP-binding protein [Lachnospiraceae bacterium]
MGTYVNPKSESMESAVNSEIYVDKTGLLRILNASIGTERRCFAVSRARRFGKSMAAGMIDAYYSRGCDSKELFEPYEIAKDPDFEKYLNKFNVLHFDVASFLNDRGGVSETINRMDADLLEDMLLEFPYLKELSPRTAAKAVSAVYRREGIRFVVIIDEYDCIIRDAADNEELIREYLRYLRGFFKTEESKQFLAIGYITGILPIKKVNGESALNNFMEYTMTDPKELQTFFGFTQEEINGLCERYERNHEDIRDWYDGYYMYGPAPETESEEGEDNADGSVREFEGSYQRLKHMYNPNSTVDAFMKRKLSSYWKNTGSFASLRDFITLNYAGLKDDVVSMLSGERVPVSILGFQNDVTQFRTKDDVLTCLIHMGYLGYDAYNQETFIPNREVAEVFESAIITGDWDDVGDALRRSRELLRAVYNGDEEKVAKVIAESHQDYASIINYHDENSLATAIMMSFYTARADYYVKRELPAGRGFADIVFIPKMIGRAKPIPAMIVELKWNRSAKAAIKQIKDRTYTGALSDYHGELILVGINYTKKTGKYTCRIERTQQ